MRHELRERLVPLLVLGATLAAAPAAVELAVGGDAASFTGRRRRAAAGRARSPDGGRIRGHGRASGAPRPFHAAAVRRLVRDHHERLDGSGYPRGLRADEIDLESRILTACDVYDALISSRVYRPAWTHERAGAPPPGERHGRPPTLRGLATANVL
jgi:hypothetical protein